MVGRRVVSEGENSVVIPIGVQGRFGLDKMRSKRRRRAIMHRKLKKVDKQTYR